MQSPHWNLKTTPDLRRSLKQKAFANLFWSLNHSHKETNSLETRVVLIEIFMLCWNLPSGPKHGESLKGISCLEVAFVLIWIKQTLIWLNLQRDVTGNGLSNTKDTFPESLQVQITVQHRNMCILKSGLSSSYDS